MQINHCFRKRTFLLLPLIAISFIFFPISSCHDSSSVKVFTNPEDCITMTWAQVNSWKQTGWGTPGDPNFVPCLYFYPTAPPGQKIQVWAYPTNKDTVVQIGKAISMSIANLKPPCGFPVALSGVLPNYYYFFANGLINTNGDLIPFTYLRLRPQACTSLTFPNCDGTQLDFRVEIVTDLGGGGQNIFWKGDTKPCPPYCPVQ